MHELGIMTGVVDSVSQAARESGATRVLKVTLSVGVMTEAIEDALHFAFEVLTEQEPFFKGAELVVNMIEPKSRCPECGGIGRLIEGREMRIESIEVDIPDPE